MNTIFHGKLTRGELVYDYSGIYTRRSGGVDWRAIVRSADVVARPSGTLDDGLSDSELQEVIRQLIDSSVEDDRASWNYGR